MARGRKKAIDPPQASSETVRPILPPIPAMPIISASDKTDAETFDDIAVSPQVIGNTALALKGGQWQPWHDEVVRLMLQSLSPTEISQRLDMPYDKVITLTETEWFAESLAKSRVGFQRSLMQRMELIWGLTQDIVDAQKMIIECFVAGAALPTGEIPKLKDIQALFKDLLDRGGTRMPEEHVIKSMSMNLFQTETTITHKEELSFEKRLKLVKEYKEQGLSIPPELGVVEVKEEDGDG